jgi:hypothetical protein
VGGLCHLAPHHRRFHSHPSTTAAEYAATTESTERCIDGCFLSGVFVSNYSCIGSHSGRCANSNFFGSTCVISGIRIRSLRASLTDTDITWTTPETAFWSMGEVSSAIMCVCIPRPHKPKEAGESEDSSARWRNQLSDETGHLETQPSVHSLANVDNKRLIS